MTDPKEELAEYLTKMNKLDNEAWLAEATAKHDKVIGRFLKHNPPNHTWLEIAYQYNGKTTVRLDQCVVCKEKKFRELYIWGGGGY